MTMLRAPRLTSGHLKILKDLLRLDYCRALQAYIQRDRDNPQTHIAETCLNLLKLTDTLTEAENPLTVTSAVMEINSADTVLFPLKEEKYNLYLRILTTSLAPESFPGLTPAQIDDIISPYREYQAELVKIFEDADYIDTEAFSQNVPLSKEPISGLLN